MNSTDLSDDAYQVVLQEAYEANRKQIEAVCAQHLRTAAAIDEAIVSMLEPSDDRERLRWVIKALLKRPEEVTLSIFIYRPALQAALGSETQAVATLITEASQRQDDKPKQRAMGFLAGKE